MSQVDYWELTGDTTTIVDGLASDTFDRQLGGTERARLIFRPAGRATGHDTRAETVHEYVQYAGETPQGRAYQGGVWYQEQLDASAPVTSLVVQLRPVPTQTDTQYEGIWGLVTGGTSPNRLTNRIVLELEVVYLGDASEYADRSAIDSALGTAPL